MFAIAGHAAKYARRGHGEPLPRSRHPRGTARARCAAVAGLCEQPARERQPATGDGEPDLECRDLAHAQYMVLNTIGHSETPGNPGYTVAGDQAAMNGNVAVSAGSTTYRQRRPHARPDRLRDLHRLYHSLPCRKCRCDFGRLAEPDRAADLSGPLSRQHQADAVQEL